MTRDRVLPAIVVPIEVVLAALAWRDLNRRRDAQGQRKTRLWRAFILMNPGNSIFYWLFGRRGMTQR